MLSSYIQEFTAHIHKMSRACPLAQLIAGMGCKITQWGGGGLNHDQTIVCDFKNLMKYDGI